MGLCSSQSAQKRQNVNQPHIAVQVVENNPSKQEPKVENASVPLEGIQNQAYIMLNNIEKERQPNIEVDMNIKKENEQKDDALIMQSQESIKDSPYQFEKEKEQVKQEQMNSEVVDNANLDVDAKMGEISEQIEIDLIPRYNQIQILSQSQILPCIVKMKMNEQQQLQQKQRNNLDLICLVDVSGSMSGEKLQNVKDSLRYIQKILSPEDQLAIVSFHTWSTVELDWTFSSIENKEQIKSKIASLFTQGTTNIAEGFDQCLQMIRRRQHKNPVCSIFLLTDGQDDDANVFMRCQNSLNNNHIQEKIVMHTFGYGQEHDAIALNELANLTGGKFIYIQEVEKAAENFILCLGGMLSIVAMDVQLVITETSPKCRIAKTFGDWKQQQDGMSYALDIAHLCKKEEKIFVFELEILADNLHKFNEETILQASISGTIIMFQKHFLKQQQLKIQFTTQPVQYEQKEIVEVNYLRAVAGEKIGEAMKLADQQQYDQAQQILKQMSIQVENQLFKDNQAMIVLQKDLAQVRELCKPQILQFDREAQMLKKQRNHVQQDVSLNNSQEWNSEQEMYIEQIRNGEMNLTNNNLSCNRSLSQDERRSFHLSEVQFSREQSVQQSSISLGGKSYILENDQHDKLEVNSPIVSKALDYNFVDAT